MQKMTAIEIWRQASEIVSTISNEKSDKGYNRYSVNLRERLTETIRVAQFLLDAQSLLDNE